MLLGVVLSSVHCGVLEAMAEEGYVSEPYWMSACIDNEWATGMKMRRHAILQHLNTAEESWCDLLCPGFSRGGIRVKFTL